MVALQASLSPEPETLRMFDKAMEVLATHGVKDDLETIRALHSAVTLCIGLDQLERAGEYCSRALMVSDERDETIERGLGVHALARLQAARGNAGSSTRYLEEAQEALRRSTSADDPDYIAASVAMYEYVRQHAKPSED